MRPNRMAFQYRAASTLMLFAVVAFPLQGTTAIVARAAASMGYLPQPAEVVGGPIHFHGQLGHHSHAPAENVTGHVHTPSGPHHPDVDDDAQIWTLGCTSAVISVLAGCSAVLLPADKLERPSQRHMAGFEPDGTSRPPSTPSIA